MSIYNEECKGCMSHEGRCLLRPMVKSVQCPCLTCLIKSMCYRSCEMYNKFIDLHIKEKKFTPANGLYIKTITDRNN